MLRIVESLRVLCYWGATETAYNGTYTIVRRKAWGLVGKEEKKRRESGAVLSRATRGPVHSRELGNKYGPAEFTESYILLRFSRIDSRNTSVTKNSTPSCHTRHIIAVSCMYALDE